MLIKLLTEIQLLIKSHPTKRAPDVWDSAAFSSIFLASSFSCSQAESTPAHTQVTQAVGQFLANKVGCMKNFRVVIVGITLLLFVGGILLSTLALEITQTVSGKQLFFIRVESEFYLRASLGFLLAFCSICASGFYWMCTKIFSKGTPTFLYIVSLFMSLISAVFGIWIKLLIIKFAFQPLPISYDYGIDESLAIEFIDYFSWGAGYVIFTNLILASLIWLFSYQKKKTINNTLAT